jgi:hypothetical protein
MSTPAISPLDQLAAQDEAAQPTPGTDAQRLSPLDQLEQQQAARPTSATSVLTSTPSDEQASQNRQSMVAGMTGRPSPNMTAQDRQNFQTGKVIGTASGAAVGSLPVAPELLSAYGKTAVDAVAKMAADHPLAAAVLKHVLQTAGIGVTAGAVNAAIGGKFNATHILKALGE